MKKVIKSTKFEGATVAMEQGTDVHLEDIFRVAIYNDGATIFADESPDRDHIENKYKMFVAFASGRAFTAL